MDEKENHVNDIYGIFQSILSLFALYRDMSRRKGRTTTLLNVVEDEDVVVFSTFSEASRFEHMAKCAGKEIRPEVCPPNPMNLNLLYDRLHKYRGGKLYFDHTWLEEYYTNSMYDANDALRSVAESASMVMDSPKEDNVAMEYRYER